MHIQDLKKKTKRTIIILFEKDMLIKMKKNKMKNAKTENNLWNALHYWCNCNRGTCTVTPCSHVMMIMYLFYCCQNDISINNSKHYERILQSVDLGIVYKKWAMKHEKTCIPTCKTFGYDKVNMIKCSGCQTSYHYKCLFEETGITKEMIKAQNNKLLCNIGQPCLYLRNQQFVKNWLKNYH